MDTACNWCGEKISVKEAEGDYTSAVLGICSKCSNKLLRKARNTTDAVRDSSLFEANVIGRSAHFLTEHPEYSVDDIYLY